MAQQKSLIASIQDSFNSFEKPSNWYVELGMYAIAGFIVGFLVKHGGRFFFMLLLGAFLALWALDYFQIVTIHYPTFKSVVGLPVDTTFHDATTVTITWIKEHIIESIATFFGFILARKLT